MVVAPDRPTPGIPEPEQPVAEDIVTEDPPMGISIGKLSVMTGLSRSLLYSRAHAGDLPGCRLIGARFLIHLETFEEYLKAGNGQSDTPRKPRKPRVPSTPKVEQKVEEPEKTRAPFWRILGI